MTEFGSLIDEQEIKLFILYILNHIGKPCERQILSDSAVGEGIIDFFGFSTALPELVENKQVEIFNENNIELYGITPLGTNILNELMRLLPRHARDSAVRAIFDVTSRLRRDKQLKCDYIPENGGYLLTCRILEGESQLLSVTIYVPCEAQLIPFINKFKTNAEKIYGGIITLFTSEI